jgi:hypothetical protein
MQHLPSELAAQAREGVIVYIPSKDRREFLVEVVVNTKEAKPDSRDDVTVEFE